MSMESAPAMDLSDLWASVERLTAVGRWRDAVVTLRAVADASGSLNVRISLGTLLAERGQLRAAIEEWVRVIDAAEVVGNRSALAAVYHNIAAVYRSLGELELASRFQQRSLTWLDDCGPEDLLQLADDALARRSWELAESMLDAAEELANVTPIDEDLVLKIRSTKGMLSGFLGRPREGVQVLRQAWRQHRSLGDDRLAGQDLVNLAALLEQTDQLGLAACCLQTAVRHFRAAEDAVELNRARHLLKRIAKSRALRRVQPLCN